MSTERYTKLKREIRKSLDDRSNSNALLNCMQRGRDKRSEALAALPGGEAFRADVKKAKERCIADQNRLLTQFITNSEKRGAKVFQAETGADAIKYVLDLAQARGAKTVAKSKSLTTEEIEINHPLIDEGLRVVETDLGELIIQLVDEKPYHLVFPSVHKMAPEVAEIFSKEIGEVVPNDIPSIMKVVRKYLRPIFLNADIGMTGANIGIAETGGIVIETNEGNGRLVCSIGDCHVCIMGVEKIVESVEDALLMVLAHPVSASGQLPTTYVTWMHGRSPLGDGESREPRESHIIILDNGRSETREDDGLRESLHCIRCGACMNVCPTYGVVGGHTFGHIYPGPIGIPWTALAHGLETAGDFASLCISCGLCKEICPAQIDIPMMIAEVKDRDAKTHGHLHVDKVMMGADKAAKLGSATAPLANWALKQKPIRKVMEKVTGVSAERELPPFASKTFMAQFKGRTPNQNVKKRVAYFVDVFANHNRPDLALAAVDHLETMDYEVVVPDQTSSGYPYIAYGDLEKAREVARYNVDRLAPLAKEGVPIIATEPTAAYCLKASYPKLLNGDANAQAVADQSYEFFEYVLANEDPDSVTQTLRGKHFGFHASCHQRPLGCGEGAMEWLRRRGAAVEFIETGSCCGMGGTFGLKAGPLGHDLSMAVGEPLFDKFKEASIDAIVTESSVCGIQLKEGTGLPLFHPLELLKEMS